MSHNLDKTAWVTRANLDALIQAAVEACEAIQTDDSASKYRIARAGSKLRAALPPGEVVIGTKPFENWTPEQVGGVLESLKARGDFYQEEREFEKAGRLLAEARIDRLEAVLGELYLPLLDGEFYDDHDWATGMVGRVAAELPNAPRASGLTKAPEGRGSSE